MEHEQLLNFFQKEVEVMQLDVLFVVIAEMREKFMDMPCLKVLAVEVVRQKNHTPLQNLINVEL